MNATKVGAFYIRVSTSDQAELSPDAQKRLLYDYAENHHIQIPTDFIFEESVSGRTVLHRPQFQKMIALAKQREHPIDIILVWKYSRFARNQEESIVYKSMLKKDGVEVVSISEPLIDGPFGTLIERIIEWMDEYYSIRLSGEVIRGMKEKALRHGYQSTPPLGYNAAGDGTPFLINEQEFQIVSYIFHLYDDEHLDPTKIARLCNDLGYRTKRGNLFERRTISYLLQNPFYSGTVLWNGISFEGTHETRFSKEQYDSRMEQIAKSRQSPRQHPVSSCRHWLSGLLKCSICGATLSYTGNAKCPSFQCWKYAKGFHKVSVSLSVKKAEAAVYAYFDQMDFEKNSVYLPKTLPKHSSAPDKIHLLKTELRKLDQKELRIRDAYENGIDTLEEYKENRLRLKKQREILCSELLALETQKKEDSLSTTSLLTGYSTISNLLKDPLIDYEVKGRFLRSILHQIVYDKNAGKLFFDIIV